LSASRTSIHAWSIASTVGVSGRTATVGGVLRVALGDRLDVGGEGRREERRLPRLRHELDDSWRCRARTEIEEAVGLIEDEHPHLREVAGPSGDEVEQAAGRRHGDVSATAQRELLIAVADPAVQRDDTSGTVPPQRFELGSDLRAELARRDDHRARTARSPGR